jgi:DNA-binding CsgD family transcriptional regulator
MSEVDIAKGYGITTTQLRALRSIAKTEQKQAQIGMAQRLKDKGLSNVAIGTRMGINESSVRALLAPGQALKVDSLEITANILRDLVAEKKYLDIGAGVENHLNVSTTKLKTAVAVLVEEGYTVHSVQQPQLGTGKNTTIKVLAPPNTTWGEVMRNRADIKLVTNVVNEGDRSSFGLLPPIQIASSRVAVRYGNEGGANADGVIYVRPGVADISLGKARYAQVRIAVEGTHYIKGMAMYKDDLPPGIDLLFNTNKPRGENNLDAFKKMKEDADNPFGAVVNQLKERDADGNLRVTSALNIVNEEGNWEKWSKTLPSQMLSKQSPTLARTQLNMTLERRKQEFEELVKLTNPSIRKDLLMKFGDSTDLAAVHLKAAQLPRQGTHVILPIESMPPSQVYAPRYRDGETVVLIRFPHGGTFEIPELTVNNKHHEAKSLLGDARDAIGIHHSVAERLSGADFDGDTVMVIPNNNRKVKTTPALVGLQNFNPREQYAGYEGMPAMSARTKGVEMGHVSNLIADMTIKRASTEELARAIRHSMVVIDAEKWNLNYRQSAIDNGIPALRKKYQRSVRGGASTLISNSGETARVAIPERKKRSAAKGGEVDVNTGKRVYENTGASYVNEEGKTVYKVTRVAKLSLVDDVSVYSSGTPMERLYATHANELKRMANEARRIAVNTPPSKYSPSAAQTYKPQVESLNNALALALRNAPLERQAQLIAGTIVKAKRQEYPDMDPASLKKIKWQALEEARRRTGAGKQKIVVSESEWAAIQAGAISPSKLSKILANADGDVIRQFATPKQAPTMSTSSIQRASAMLKSGATRAEIADQLGLSVTTLSAVLEAEGIA